MSMTMLMTVWISAPVCVNGRISWITLTELRMIATAPSCSTEHGSFA